MRDSSILFPELWLKVFVSGPPEDAAGFPEMFMRARCFKAETPEEADLVVFTGGPDVNPTLYSDGPVPETVYIDDERDKADIELYSKCYHEGIPMFGVCRGAQLGAVMNGAELFMDVDGHNCGQHPMFTRTGTIPVSSVHHQMVMRSDGMDLLGWSRQSDKRFVTSTLVEHGSQEDVEAFFFEDSCFFGVQGHPEYKGFFAFAYWCFGQIEELIINNINIEPVNGLYRLKEDFRKQRDFEMKEKAA